jgi:hypothetical protein
VYIYNWQGRPQSATRGGERRELGADADTARKIGGFGGALMLFGAVVGAVWVVKSLAK